MSDLMPDKATICVINYKTPDLTRLCLRSIRKYTQCPYDVLVIDNDSCDESTAYLRSLSWIRLIERKPETPDLGPEVAHGSALDLGLSHCQTEFFVSLHSDTVVLQSGWLDMLIRRFTHDGVASVGCGKLEPRPAWILKWKRLTDYHALYRKLFWNKDQRARYQYFNRTVCSAYKTAILKKEALSFAYEDRRRLTVGHQLHRELKAHGYSTVAVSDTCIRPYVMHLMHATQVLHADNFDMTHRALRRYGRVLRSAWASESVQSILSDSSLDH